MTKDEMQRFLNREADRGTQELEAWRALAQIIGIVYPNQDKPKNTDEDENRVF